MFNPKEPLYILAERIDWDYFEREFERYYIDFSRLAHSIRLMVSLLILRQMYSLSDESLVEEWRQNPYLEGISSSLMIIHKI